MLRFFYSDPAVIDAGGNSTDLGFEVVRYGTMSVTQSADVGQGTISTIEIDDPDGSLLFSGLRAFTIMETLASDRIIFRGPIQNRRVMRADSMRTGSARRWSIDVSDLNWALGSRVLVDQDSKRPDETAGDRLRWLLLNAAHFSPSDYGHVSYPSDQMEANDYRGQRATDVLADIAVESGYTFWCEYNDAHGLPELFFLDPNGTSYTSTAVISNDYASDAPGFTTTMLVPYEDAYLERSADRLAFGVYLAYENGSVYVRNNTTGAQFGKQDQTAPMSNVKREARARRIATHFLNQHDEEDDRIYCSVKVPAASVNDIRAGHRLSAKFTHLPGYEDFTYMRVMQRTVVQEEEGGGYTGIDTGSTHYYKIILELSPTGDAAPTLSCSTALSGMVTATLNDDDADSPSSYSITPVDGSNSVIICGLVVRNRFTPDAHAAHTTAASYTEVYADQTTGSDTVGPWEHPTWSVGYKPVTGASGSYSINATYTGHDRNAEGWALASFTTSATSPVQSKFAKFPSSNPGTVTLTASPTAGHMLVMVVTVRDQAAYPTTDLFPATGWTQIAIATAAPNDGGQDSVGIYARCVQSGDGSIYGLSSNNSNSHSVTVMEWVTS